MSTEEKLIPITIFIIADHEDYSPKINRNEDLPYKVNLRSKLEEH